MRFPPGPGRTRTAQTRPHTQPCSVVARSPSWNLVPNHPATPCLNLHWHHTANSRQSRNLLLGCAGRATMPSPHSKENKLGNTCAWPRPLALTPPLKLSWAPGAPEPITPENANASCECGSPRTPRSQMIGDPTVCPGPPRVTPLSLDSLPNGGW